MELAVANRGLLFTDGPLFQEGNEIVARFVRGLASKQELAEIEAARLPEGGESKSSQT